MHIAPSGGEQLLDLNLPCKLILRRFDTLRLFSDVWSENAALFERFMKFIQIHSYFTLAFKD